MCAVLLMIFMFMSDGRRENVCVLVSLANGVLVRLWDETVQTLGIKM